MPYGDEVADLAEACTGMEGGFFERVDIRMLVTGAQRENRCDSHGGNPGQGSGPFELMECGRRSLNLSLNSLDVYKHIHGENSFSLGVHNQRINIQGNQLVAFC